jgi:hypothetical protein
MPIIDANTPRAEQEILGILDKMGADMATVAGWLKFSLGTDVFGAWLAVHDDKPVGLLLCELVEPNDPKVYIAFYYARPCSKVNGELLEHAHNWAKAKAATKLIFYTKRSPATLIKKHGSRLVHSVLDKEVT